MRRVSLSLLATALAVAAQSQSSQLGAANESTFRKEVPLVAEHNALLGKNKFVVSPAPGMIQMHYVYDQNDYQNLPSIVTIDTSLHLYHILFDATLRTTESSTLYPRAHELARKMLASTKAAYESEANAEVKAAHLQNLAFFAVADRLFGGTTPVPAAAQSIVDNELKAIQAQTGMAPSPIFGTEVDYSQFIVRGHYTKTETLKRYFRGMMWFGLVPFSLANAAGEPDEPRVLQVLALSRVFSTAKAEPQWNAVYEPTTLFAGTVNSLTPAMVEVARTKTMGSGSITDQSKYPALLAELQKMNPSLYKPAIEFRPNAPDPKLQMRFMPQRGLLDGYAISRVTKAIDRPMPSGLDVMATLGNGRAAQILDGSPALYNPNGWTDYVKNRLEATKYMQTLPAKSWKENLYNAWLDTIRCAAETPSHAVAPFMKTEAYKDKGLNTGLASYAELRHDTILYGEQTAVEMGDGEEEQPYVRQYVEPNLPVYERLVWMTRALRDGLAKHKLLTPESMEDISRYGTIVGFLKSCAEQQVAGKALPKASHLRIRKIGGEIEYLTTDLLLRGTNYQTLTANDRDMALVADIHSADPLAFTIASGHADDMIALVPIEGKTYLARGPVYSYYEFTVPMSERMNDDQWKQMLAEGKQPARPKWTSSFRTSKPAREVADQQ